MRSTKDRRKRQIVNTFPLEIDDEALLLSERRKAMERRLENLADEELQLLFSEMPGLDDEETG